MGSATRKPRSGRPKIASVPGNGDYINLNIYSQEDKLGSHLSQRTIAKNLSI